MNDTKLNLTRITPICIDGREIDLSNDQIKNYEKYCEKYGLEPKP